MKSDWCNFGFIVLEMGGKEHHLKGRERTRMKVRIRDGFKCRSCGVQRTLRQVADFNASKKNETPTMKLHDVHHLDGECGKNSRGYDSEDVIDKLITLCHKCHYNHHQFSKKLSQHFVSIRGHTDPSRTEQMKEWRAKGETLQCIGNRFNISRERVRQLLL